MAHPEPANPNPAASEPRCTDLGAVQQENERLRELVVQLSKLVVKYVLAGTSLGEPPPIHAALRRGVANASEP